MGEGVKGPVHGHQTLVPSFFSMLPQREAVRTSFENGVLALSCHVLRVGYSYAYSRERSLCTSRAALGEVMTYGKTPAKNRWSETRPATAGLPSTGDRTADPAEVIP